MGTIWIILIAIGCTGFGFWLGYQFCLIRWAVKEIMKVLEIMTKRERGELTALESYQQIAEIGKELKQ